MTKEEMDGLDVWLAENLMKWHRGMLWFALEEKEWWFDGNNQRQYSVARWDPTRNDSQAIECAEKTGLPYHINKLSANNYFCEIGDSNSFACESTLSLAVSLACKKAWEGK